MKSLTDLIFPHCITKTARVKQLFMMRTSEKSSAVPSAFDMHVITEKVSVSFCKYVSVCECICTSVCRIFIGVRTPIYVRTECESVPLPTYVCVYVCVRTCHWRSNTYVRTEFKTVSTCELARVCACVFMYVRI